MDTSAPRPRANRKTFSCTECRRRKQKCNQQQPCNNCRRRFPEPICEYGPRSKRQEVVAGYGTLPTFVVARPPSRSPSPVYHISRYPRRLPPSWSPVLDRRRRRGPGFVVRWSGVNLTTEYPVCEDFDDDEWETIPTSSTLHPPSHNTKPSRKSSPSQSSHFYDVVRSRTPSSSTASGGQDVELINPHRALQANSTGHLWYLNAPADCMGNLPISATRENAVLVKTFSELMYHFKGSFDGVPDPDNPFVNHYVPWCIQSPLLAQTSLYISARSLAERGFVDQRSTMKIKGQAIHSLNEQLRSEAWIGDEAMAAVVQFISIEWFFGETEVVLAHLKGLREMVRLRGGFTTAGVGALVTKVALVDDCVIALSLDSTPVLQREPGINFQYNEPPPERFIIRHNSPLLPDWISFASCAEVLGLHPTTASILDDIRFLISATLAIPAEAPPEKVKKLQTTARWIYDRICKLPEDSPEASAPSNSPNSASKSPVPTSDSDDLSPEQSPEPHSLLPKYPAFSSSRQPSDEPQPPVGGSSPQNPPPPTQNSPAPPPAPKPNPPPLVRAAVPDPLYTAVRLAAPIYAHALATRRPLAEACAPADALKLLGATWRVPLARWRGVVGVFLFVLAPIVATVTRCGAVAAARAGSASESTTASESGATADDAAAEGDGKDPSRTTSSGSGGGAGAGTGEVILGIESHLAPHAGFVKSILQIGFMQIALEDWPVCAEMMGRVLGVQRWLRGLASGACEEGGGAGAAGGTAGG